MESLGISRCCWTFCAFCFSLMKNFISKKPPIYISLMITEKLEKEFCYCCFFKQNIVFSFVSIDVSFYTFYICLMYHFKKKMSISQKKLWSKNTETHNALRKILVPKVAISKYNRSLWFSQFSTQPNFIYMLPTF